MPENECRSLMEKLFLEFASQLSLPERLVVDGEVSFTVEWEDARLFRPLDPRRLSPSA